MTTKRHFGTVGWNIGLYTCFDVVGWNVQILLVSPLKLDWKHDDLGLIDENTSSFWLPHKASENEDVDENDEKWWKVMKCTEFWMLLV